MLLPNDELKVKVSRIDIRDGSIVVKIETVNDRGEKVLEGSTEIAQATTVAVYAFTGQHLQEAGMGVDLYNSSPTACHMGWCRCSSSHRPWVLYH
jgi:fatty acid synthase subunit alpha, fungi type